MFQLVRLEGKHATQTAHCAMYQIVKPGDFGGTLERAGCKQPKSARLRREFQGVIFPPLAYSDE